MHSPAFFITLLAAASSIAQAGPVITTKREKATLPGFFQPLATSLPVAEIPSFAGQAVPTTAQEAATAATNYLSSSLGLDYADIQASNALQSPDTNLFHIHLTESFHGLPIANAVSNVNIDASSGAVVSMFQSFVPSEIRNSTIPVQKRDTPMISLEAAILKFAEAKGFSTADKLTVVEKDKNDYAVEGASFAVETIRGSQKYYQTGSGLVHVWDFNVQMKNQWQNVFVNSETGEIVGVSNWTVDYIPEDDEATSEPKARRDNTIFGGIQSSATNLFSRAGEILDAVYNVIPVGARNPQSNNGFTKVQNPWNLNASPQGWHTFKNQQRKDLAGNNVFAQSNPNNVQDISGITNLPRPSSNNLNFNYPFNPNQGSNSQSNRDAATTSMFYLTNAMHDVFYNYGFTEAAGNFQYDNFGKGGRGEDPVVATSQDGAGTNNANFWTGPDGYPGKMRMYVFTYASPNRDGALENDIVIHETGHGLSTRLTGGAANANCLQSMISGGLGEGWSDIVGYILSLPHRNSDYAMGYWALNNKNGIRRYPYSTSLQRNPHVYSTLNRLNEVHDIGEVWAAMLYEVMWNLIDIAGFTPPSDIVNQATSGTGNTVLLKILIAAMKIQPCNPSFMQARNAIFTAEKNLYGGKFACAIWKGFAKRGMGVNASGNSYSDNFNVPQECNGNGPAPVPKPTGTVSTIKGPVKTPTTTTTKKNKKPKQCHTVCAVGGALAATCGNCAAKVCKADSFCCTRGWDNDCVGLVKEVCKLTC
ncbi:Fungalysin metallopeptidase-domain-containing protein [Obelidium mucronatum]|nr:Fungalysin metallopeptidase-domain-containing protein [Obelidium mucronatum]